MSGQSIIRGELKSLGASLADFSGKWDELNSKLFASHPLFDSRFINLLLLHFGSGKERLLRLTEGGATCGMVIVQSIKFGRWQTFTPSQLQVTPLMFYPNTTAKDIFSWMPRATKWLDLLSVDPRYFTLGNSLDNEQFSIRHQLTMSIELSGTLDDYWNSRSKQLRNNMARYQRRIERSGLKTSFRIYGAPSEMQDAVIRYGRLEAQGWKGLKGTAVTEGNDQGQFYSSVLTAFAITDQALVMELWLGDQLAASRLFIHNDRTIICLKTAFNEELKAYAPGRILLKEAIFELFVRFPQGTIEFCTDATPDQISWATHQRFIMHKTLYPGEFSRVAMQGMRLMLSYFKKYSKSIKYRKNYTVTSYSALDEVPETVNTLLRQAEQQSVEFGLVWFKNFLSTVRDSEREYKFYVLECNNSAVAILPVSINRKARRVEQLGNYYTSLYSPLLNPVAGSGELKLLLRSIVNEFPDVVEFFFTPLDSNAQESLHLRDAFQRIGWISFGFSYFGNWFLPVFQGWDDYLASRDGQVRSTVKRMERKFAKAGGTVELSLGGDRLEHCIDAYQAVYAKSWKIPEPYPEFMPGLIRAMSSIGALRMAIAWLDERPVASQVWIVSHGKASIFKLAYDEAYAEYSPGTVLTTQLFKHVMTIDRVKEIDYLIGDDPYKKLWMSHRRERRGLIAYNPKSIIGLARLIRELAGRVFKHLRSKLKMPLRLSEHAK